MPTQSSLIVQRGIATMRTVEEAISRQVLHGGDLATNLLEVASLDEPALVAVLAEGHGLPPGPAGRLPAPDPVVLRTIPGELALRHGIFPLRRDDRTLILATSEPLSSVVEEDFAFAMDVAIRQEIVPLVRIRQAIAEHYGIALDRRFLRLVARLEGHPDPSPSTMPPPGAHFGPVHLPRPASVPPVTFGTGVSGPPFALVASKTERVVAPDHPVAVPAIPRIGTPRLEGLASTLMGPAALLGPELPGPPRKATSSGLGVPPPPLGPPIAVQRERAKALAGWIRRALFEGKLAAKAQPAVEDEVAPRRIVIREARSLPPGRGRRKGPYTPAMAEEDLSQAADKDAVLDVVFALAQQYFAYTALFVVQGDLAEGRAARGLGADTAKVRGIGVPLDLPSALSTARDRRGPVVAQLGRDGLDAELARDLGRPLPLGAVAILPVVVRSRSVALLWGDDGAESVELGDVGDVVACLGLAVTALERIVREKKRGRRGVEPALPRPPRSAQPSADAAGRAQALVRALALPGATGGSPPPSGARPSPEPSAAAIAPSPPAAPVQASFEPDGAAPALQISPGAESVRPAHIARAAEATGLGAGLDGPLAISPVAESLRAPAVEERPAEVSPGEGQPAAPSGEPGSASPSIEDEDSGETLDKAIARVVDAPPPLPGRVPDKSRLRTEAELAAEGWGVTPPPHAPDEREERDGAGAPADRSDVVPPRERPTAREGRGTLRGFGPPPLEAAATPPAPAVEANPLVDGAGVDGPRANALGFDWGKPSALEAGIDGGLAEREARGRTADWGDVDFPLERGAGRPAMERGRSPAPGFSPRPRGTSPGVGSPLPPEPPLNALRAPSSSPPLRYSGDDALPPAVGRDLDGNEYPLAPPPATIAAVRPLSRKPIPREEIESVPPPPPAAAETFETPGGVVLGAGDATPLGPPMVRPAHRPTPRPGSVLPSIIVDVTAEYDQLLARVVAAGPGSDEAFAEAVRHGEQILPALVARFPGPLRVDRHRARDLLPAASQCGPILELCVALRRTALPFVTVRTTSPDPDLRFWATHVLGELRYPEAANAVLPRLFDDEAAVRRIARRSAASLVAAGAAGQPIVVGLDHLTQNQDESLPRRELAIETMGEIRSGVFVPTLIAALGDRVDEVADAARRALLLTTRQDFGREAVRWAEWWSANGPRHRVEWLIDALMHDMPSVRRAAGDELKQLTKEYFGYYDDLPKRERERAQVRYREWWEREGRRRFG